jgi:hypothetical protein
MTRPKGRFRFVGMTRPKVRFRFVGMTRPKGHLAFPPRPAFRVAPEHRRRPDATPRSGNPLCD